jgi:hypothetical protein
MVLKGNPIQQLSDEIASALHDQAIIDSTWKGQTSNIIHSYVSRYMKNIKECSC